VKEGKVLWDMPHDHFNRKALWKEGEKKFAIVFFVRDEKSLWGHSPLRL
jgi:hypothetical protein